jgi:hypothetical protein
MSANNSDLDKEFERVDRAFDLFRRENPGVSFGQYATELQLKSIQTGKPHPTLGTNLKSKPDWRQAGKATFDSLVRRYAIRPDHAVADYGCGSLRVGAHFIEYLEPDRYFGIDVIMGFIDIGVDGIGQEIVREKKPIFRDFSTLTPADAEKFNADIVYSTACLFQIHPDDQEEMFRNLNMLARKPGSRLIFDTMLAEQPLRYRNSAWAWPKDHYVRNLPGFDLVETRTQDIREESGHNVEWTWLVFQRKG